MHLQYRGLLYSIMPLADQAKTTFIPAMFRGTTYHLPAIAPVKL